MDKYEDVICLQKGGFGTVYQGINRLTGAKEIIKKVSQLDETYVEGSEQIPKEVLHLRKCQNIDGVIPLLDWFTCESGYVIVMPFIDNACDMLDYIQEYDMSENDGRFIMKQLATIVRECHRLNIYHCDLKLENILIHKMTKKIYLIDFGCSRLLKNASTCKTYAGTPENVPPEFLISGQYDAKLLDIWSLGLILYDMLCKSYPFHNNMQIRCAPVIFPATVDLSDACKQLILHCLDKDPTLRPCLTCILNHKWMNM